MPAPLHVRSLSDAEVAALRRLERSTRDAAVRTRCLMLLHSHGGLTPQAIGQLLGRSPETVRRVIRHYERAGLEGLADDDHRDRPRRRNAASAPGRKVVDRSSRVTSKSRDRGAARTLRPAAARTMSEQATPDAPSAGPEWLGPGAPGPTRAADPMPEVNDRAANLGHELRSPLSTILGFAQLLASAPPGSLDPDRQARFVAEINRAGDYMLRLIDDLVDLRRVESGVEPLQLVMLELAPFLDSALQRFRPQAEDKGLALSLDAEPDLWPIVTDELLLRRVVDNLLSNAVKYTPGGGAVRLGAAWDGEGVAITVADTGVGLTEDEQARVFERFFRGRRAEIQGERGSGLGLALAREAARRLGGDIRVTSAVGRGSAFTVRLPSRPPMRAPGTGPLRPNRGPESPGGVRASGPTPGRAPAGPTSRELSLAGLGRDREPGRP